MNVASPSFSSRAPLWTGVNLLRRSKPVCYIAKAHLSHDCSLGDEYLKESPEVPKNEMNQRILCNISPRLAISFTCKVCGHRNGNKTMSKKAYTEGVVIITCDGCGNNHLIADNLEWFADKGKKINIEKLMEQKGENIKRGFLVEAPDDGGVKEVEII